MTTGHLGDHGSPRSPCAKGTTRRVVVAICRLDAALCAGMAMPPPSIHSSKPAARERAVSPAQTSQPSRKRLPAHSWRSVMARILCSVSKAVRRREAGGPGGAFEMAASAVTDCKARLPERFFFATARSGAARGLVGQRRHAAGKISHGRPPKVREVRRTKGANHAEP